MKKFLSLLLSVTMLSLLLASCTSDKVKVNGVKVDEEIYTYFYELTDKSLSEDERDAAARQSISRYVAINSEFMNQGLSLTSSQKADVSDTVGNLWHLFGTHYDSIGVSKQTLYKIETSKAYEYSLLENYYSENGKAPVNEEDIKKYFEENYVAIRFVTGYLFNFDENGAAVPMTEEQKNNTADSFTSVSSMINDGTIMEEAVITLGENVDIHDNLVSRANYLSTFPEGFFDAAKAIEKGKAATVVLGDYIFLVERIDVFDEVYGYYSTYRTDCLKQMKGEEFSKIVDEWAKSYVAE